MFKFGKAKPSPNPAEPAAAPDGEEALAIGQGSAKALAGAVEAARSKASGIDSAALRSPAQGSAADARGPGPEAAQNQKARTMTNDTTTAPGNGNGGNGTRPQSSAQGGSPFTEPTPGGKQKTVAQLFGEIVWLFSQSPKHKNFFVSDLEWLVMTPILLKQFRVFYAPDRPIGVALWAYVTDEVEQRLMTGNARLAPADWKGGEKLWLVDIVAPYGGHDAMIRDLKDKVFSGREIAFLGLTDGRPAKRVI